MKSLFLLISFSICLSMPVIGHEAEAVGWQRQNVCTKHQKETFDPARFQSCLLYTSPSPRDS